jgi:hypothetical protein
VDTYSSTSTPIRWTFYTLNSLPFNESSHLFKRIQSIGKLTSSFSRGAFVSLSLTSCTPMQCVLRFGFRRRSQHQHSPLHSLRQYPLYSKTTPPAVLADHFKPEVFEKCQKYGKHKAKFSIVSGLYKQVIDTVQLASGLYYPWAWKASGQLLGLAGYGPEYLVCPHGLLHGQLFEPTFLDFSIGCLYLCLDIHFHPSNFASWSISDLRPRGTAWFQ